MMKGGKLVLSTDARDKHGQWIATKGVWPTLGAMALGMLMFAACSSDAQSCEGTDRRICLVPFGDVSGDVIGQLVKHYEGEYDLQVQVLDKQSIPEELVDPERRQVGGIALMEHMGDL